MGKNSITPDHAMRTTPKMLESLGLMMEGWELRCRYGQWWLDMEKRPSIRQNAGICYDLFIRKMIAIHDPPMGPYRITPAGEQAWKSADLT